MEVDGTRQVVRERVGGICSKVHMKRMPQEDVQSRNKWRRKIKVEEGATG